MRMNIFSYLLLPLVILQVAPSIVLMIFGTIACGCIIALRRRGVSAGAVATLTIFTMIFDLMVLLMFRKEAIGHLRGFYDAAPALRAVSVAALFLLAKLSAWQVDFRRARGGIPIDQ
jgi:hypothetical protein